MQDLAETVYQICHLTGNFTLRSGKQSTEYFDKYLFESQPEILYDICLEMVDRMDLTSSPYVLGGMETGGIPLATMLSHMTRPMVIVRKEAKTYGTCKLAEGIDIKGKNVRLIEDVITTGGQVIKSRDELVGLGAIVDHVHCVILRDESVISQFRDVFGVILEPLFVWREGKLVLYGR